MDFHVEPGRTIALVGPTGAGKTTIINLLSRFYDVSEGSVTIDGYDVRDVTLASLRRQMGVMLQDTFIFSGNVRENIRYGKLDATDEEIEAAAKAVHAHEFIMELPAGSFAAFGVGETAPVAEENPHYAIAEIGKVGGEQTADSAVSRADSALSQTDSACTPAAPALENLGFDGMVFRAGPSPYPAIRRLA